MPGLVRIFVGTVSTVTSEGSANLTKPTPAFATFTCGNRQFGVLQPLTELKRLHGGSTRGDPTGLPPFTVLRGELTAEDFGFSSLAFRAAEITASEWL